MLVRVLSAMCVMAAAMATPHDVMSRDVFPGVGEYFYIGVAANWTEALLACQQSNANLTVIETAGEAAAIRQMLTTHGASSIHLGFNDIFQEGKYNDILGQPLDSACRTGNEWAPGAPVGGTDFNCGGFSSAGLADIRCSEKRVFICEVPTTITGGPTLPGYTLIPNYGYYKTHSSDTEWSAADQICRDEGTHLLVINSAEEVDELITAQLMISTQIYHVGVHRYFGGNNNFVTVTGGTLEGTGFKTWLIGEPSGDFVTYPFVDFYPGLSGLLINAESNGFDKPFICEKEI